MKTQITFLFLHKKTVSKSLTSPCESQVLHQIYYSREPGRYASVDDRTQFKKRSVLRAQDNPIKRPVAQLRDGVLVLHAKEPGFSACHLKVRIRFWIKAPILGFPLGFPSPFMLQCLFHSLFPYNMYVEDMKKKISQVTTHDRSLGKKS